MASEEKVAAIVEGGDGDAKGADDAAAADAAADATIAAAAPPATALTTHDLGDGVTLVVSPPADYNGTSDSAKVSWRQHVACTHAYQTPRTSTPPPFRDDTRDDHRATPPPPTRRSRSTPPRRTRRRPSRSSTSWVTTR